MWCIAASINEREWNSLEEFIDNVEAIRTWCYKQSLIFGQFELFLFDFEGWLLAITLMLMHAAGLVIKYVF